MGEPLEVMKTTLRLKPDVMARLKAVAGHRGVATFLHEAVLEKLERHAGVHKPTTHR